MPREFVSSVSPTMGRAGAGGHPCQGVWYTPAGEAPRVALIACHYEVDFSEHYLADLMAQRGFGFLGWNTRYRGLGQYFNLEQAVADIGVGLRWLREVAGVETVALLGNSGGASLMSAYQSEASDKGDLFISLNAHPGRPDVLTSWLDPSVTDESDPLSVDSSLDMFEKSNGPPYSADFVARYREAQQQRNIRITGWCKSELERLEGAGAIDRTFSVFRTWADLRFLDLDLDPSARTAGCYFGDPKVANYSPFGLATTCTLPSWLSMWSLTESRCRADEHMGRVTVPSLVVQSNADQGCYPSDARTILGALASADKTIEIIDGDHYLQSPAGARDGVADLVAAWISSRF